MFSNASKIDVFFRMIDYFPRCFLQPINRLSVFIFETSNIEIRWKINLKNNDFQRTNFAIIS